MSRCNLPAAVKSPLIELALVGRADRPDIDCNLRERHHNKTLIILKTADLNVKRLLNP